MYSLLMLIISDEVNEEIPEETCIKVVEALETEDPKLTDRDLFLNWVWITPSTVIIVLEFWSLYVNECVPDP